MSRIRHQRTTEVVNLPEPAPTPHSDHAYFAPNERSPCPYHNGFCAYTGQEEDRCPYCHSFPERHTPKEAAHCDHNASQ